MRRGTRPTAAGSPTSGTVPIPASTSSTPVTPGLRSPQTRQSLVPPHSRTTSHATAFSNRHTRKPACCAGGPPPSSRHATSFHRPRTTRPTAISNRHLVQLKFTASPAISATSLFLIVPKQHVCSSPQRNSPGTRWHRHVLAESGFRFQFEQTRSISNRHLVQLQIPATRPESSSSLFLIDPSCPHFRAQSVREFYRG